MGTGLDFSSEADGLLLALIDIQGVIHNRGRLELYPRGKGLGPGPHSGRGLLMSQLAMNGRRDENLLEKGREDLDGGAFH